MKYLGLALDSHWTFGTHFERRAPSVEATANALGRLLPRLGGPGLGVRRLFAGVMRSRLLYGAPIWAEDLMASRRSCRRLHRAVAIKVLRGFRTIMAAAAAMLYWFPPFELQTLRWREIYLHTRGLSDCVDPVGADVKSRARRALLDSCRANLDDSGRAGAKGPRGRPSKLGRLVGRGRPPPDLQGDSGAYRARVLWWIPASNQKRGDRALPPLRCERGFGAAHVGILSALGTAAPRPHRGNSMGLLAADDRRGTVGEREREKGRDLLLWAGYASEGGSGKSKGAELPPREDWPAGERQRLRTHGGQT